MAKSMLTGIVETTPHLAWPPVFHGSYFTRKILEPKEKDTYLALGSTEWDDLCSSQLAFISTG